MPPTVRHRSRAGTAALLSTLLAWLALGLAACAPLSTLPRGPADLALPTPKQSAERSRQLVRMGRTALGSGDAQSAAGMLEQALILDPESAEAAVAYGDALLRMDRPQEAGEVYSRAFRRGGVPARAGYARAMIALNRPEAAVEHLREARKLAPADPGVLNALGVAHDMTGRHRAAAEAYRAGLEAAPEDRALRNNLGLSLALAGEQDAAVAALRELAEGPGSDKRARQNLALAYGLKGDALAAERLSRLDLAEDEVRNNMAIFGALRGLSPADAAVALVPTVVGPVPPVAPPLSPGAKAPGTVAKTDRRIPLAAVALDAGGLAVGASPVGSWFVNLGRSPSPEEGARRWVDLRRRNPKTLGGLSKLAGAGGGPEPLLAGPLPDEAAARATCANLRRSAPDCAPLRL